MTVMISVYFGIIIHDQVKHVNAFGISTFSLFIYLNYIYMSIETFDLTLYVNYKVQLTFVNLYFVFFRVMPFSSILSPDHIQCSNGILRYT